MKAYGYTPVSKGFPKADDHFERTRIGKFSQSKYFGTAAVYAKNKDLVSQYKIINIRVKRP
jgi:hypothetical protein